MKIAIFASAFYPHLGGVEELVRQLVHANARVGHEAIVLTNRWPRDLPRFERFEGISIYRPALRAPGFGPQSRLTFALSRHRIQREINHILRVEKVELLHVQCVSAGAFYALGAARELKLPLVVTAQGERTMDADQIFQTNPWFARVLRESLQKADAISACSRDTLDDVENWLETPFGARAQVIYNGIRLADFSISRSFSHPRPYILGIGRLVTQKGFDLLLRALSRADCASHDLILAGAGAELENLQALARALKLEDRVRFFGPANRDAAVALFQNCSFFVLPSRREPQGIVILEAMAAGRAVIAAQVGGVPEIVAHQQNGLLFPGADVEALARHLTLLARDAALRDRLGEAGRAQAQNFDWDVIAARYLALYERVLTDFQP